MTRRFRLMLSAAFAALAVCLCLVYADGVRQEADRERAETLARYGGEVVGLVVAREGLEPGDVVSAANAEVREWLADLAPDGAVTSLDDVVGLEVSVAAAKGAPLTSINFRDVTQVADVPAGHVAVTIPVTDKLGVSRNVAVGSALVAYQVTTDGVNLIAEDMTVLSSPGGQTTISSALQLTVAVLPDDVPDVLSASASNDLRLVMPAKDASGGGASAHTGAPEQLEQGATGEGREGTSSDGSADVAATSSSSAGTGEDEKTEEGNAR